ncbi:MAG: PSD1 domain-containing protein [Verrucomicrobiales bacterium]|nr:PSD1 domain-containing protein [Verrucomicrobiales bacterium]
MDPCWRPTAWARALARVILGCLLGCAGWGFGAAQADDTAEDIVRYNRDVRPLLSDHCFRCHGPDARERKGKLRLDLREIALERGAIVPGRPEASPLVTRIHATDPEELMPPPDVLKPLDDRQKAVLERWIRQGAPYEAHWAFLPIERPPIPDAPEAHGWIRTPIDAFVFSAQVRAGLRPSPEPDRSTLLRRLSLDLIGLPPTPAETAEFVRDTEAGAYERQVERLLASPHFGERMAMPWLDAVRFADTVGYHGDQNQRIFPYRDYVIAALNRNKGFDAFTLEQIAGDLLPDPTPDQRVATGFNRLNMMTREGGAQPREYLAKYQSDRVRTVSTAWLGATLGCAECHDHKYDPFTTRDFYALSAFFADVQQWGVYQDYSYTPNPDLKGWSNDHPFPPELLVDNPYLKARARKLLEREDQLLARATATLRTHEEGRTIFRRWRGAVSDFLDQHPDGWAIPTIQHVLSKGKGASEFTPAENATVLPDGSVRWTGTEPTHDRLILNLPPGWISALRVELLPAENGGATLRGSRRSGGFSWSVSRRAVGSEAEEPVTFWFADAEAKDPRYANGDEIQGILGQWRLPEAMARQRQVGTWWVAKPWSAGTGEVLTVEIPNHVAARVRISVSPIAPDRLRSPARLAEIRQLLDRSSGIWDPPVQHAFHRSVDWSEELTRDLRSLAGALRDCREGRAWTQVTVATNALVTRVLPRGNWMDESGPVVTPAVPAFLTRGGTGPATPQGARTEQGGAAAVGAESTATRLDLARWLVSRDNPLTARHLVNRWWALFFGTGLSARLEDLGLQGEWPTHPELLDWLAAEFMEPSVALGTSDAARTSPHAWDVKHVIRLMVLSSTYRQGTRPSPEALEQDPANTWLTHQNPRRLEAEMVRDQALAVAGLLDPEIGGPSVFPYQPAGYYANLQFPDREYQASAEERQYRRGIYMHWQRAFLHPMLANFDAPSREECVASRLISNTPQQALTLLNDPTFVEAARVLAARAAGATRRDEARIEWLVQQVLGRTPRAAESDSLRAFLASQRAAFEADAEGAAKLVQTGQAPGPHDLPVIEHAAWTSLARVLLNLHETITRY